MTCEIKFSFPHDSRHRCSLASMISINISEGTVQKEFDRICRKNRGCYCSSSQDGYREAKTWNVTNRVFQFQSSIHLWSLLCISASIPMLQYYRSVQECILQRICDSCNSIASSLFRETFIVIWYTFLLLPQLSFIHVMIVKVFLGAWGSIFHAVITWPIPARGRNRNGSWCVFCSRMF
jgi:hypothetical protein